MAKKTNVNPDTIYFENYNNDYRDIVRLVALYGCFSGSDIDKGNIFPLLHREDGKSFIRKSAFSTKMKQLSYLLTDEYLSASQGGVKTYSIADDIYINKNDYLHKTFKMHNFTQNQIMQFFVLLQAAGSMNEVNGEEHFTLNGIAEYIAETCEHAECEIPDALKSLVKDIEAANQANKSKPFRATFDKMLEAGYFVEIDNQNEQIYKESWERSLYYSLADDKLSELEDITLDRLYRLLDHLSKTEAFKIPYYLAKERLVTYALALCRDSENYTDKILFRHNHNYPVLDNEILYILLKAIKANNLVRIVYKHTSQNYSEDDVYEQSEIVVYPVTIINNNDDGRQFLFCLNESEMMSVRLDYVVDTTIENRADEAIIGYAETQLENIKNHVWAASAFNFGKELEHVFIKFSFGNNDYSYIQRMFVGSNRFEVKQESEHEYTVEYVIYDPFEMIPWIQSFGKCAEILETSETSKKLKNIIENNRKEMRKKYGLI